MCGRYGLSIDDAKKVYERFDVENKLYEIKPRYNIAPAQMNPVITSNSPNHIRYMFWGLIPFWAKDKKFAYKTINARSEDIDQKPSYKKPFQLQRCLVPATGFYEWTKTKPAVPYYFELKNQALFAFAGLYDVWKNPKDGQELYSYTIITTRPNDVVAKVHHRMPVILKKEDEDFWLNPDVVESERLLPLLKPYPGEDMTMHQVSTNVNKPFYDDRSLIEAVSE